MALRFAIMHLYHFFSSSFFHFVSVHFLYLFIYIFLESGIDKLDGMVDDTISVDIQKRAILKS